MGLKDLKGKLTEAMNDVKDKVPKKDQEKDKSPDWAVAFVDNLRKSPDVNLDTALAEAAKNIPNDGTLGGKAKAQTEAIAIINKEINIQIKSHPEDAEKLKAKQKALGGTPEPASPSVTDKVKDIGSKLPGGILKGKLPFGKH